MSFDQKGVQSLGSFNQAKKFREKLNRHNPAKHIRIAIWVYFLLLIFEGGLRKWVFPGLATPLLIIRDPVAIYLIIVALRQGLMPRQLSITIMVAIGFIGIVTAMFLGHGNLYVAIYGARIFIIHFPVIFIIGRVFEREDVLKMGRVLLWISIPMAVLITMQFYSPQSAFVNRGVGGDESGGGFSGALGFFRPPGTFSFTNGTTLFFSFTAPFVLYFWFNSKLINRWVLIGATVGLLFSIPFSISRALLLSVAITVFFALLGTARKPKYLSRMVVAGVGTFLTLMILSRLAVFQTAMEAFTARFDGANESEGGFQSVIVDRYLGGLVGAISNADQSPFWGYGMGALTNIGFNVLPRDPTMSLVEGEWRRMIFELGLIMGLLAVIIRTRLGVQLFISSYNHLKKGDMLPWLMTGYMLLNIPQGQWKQPTSLGFSILAAGLLIAALKLKSNTERRRQA